MAWPQRELEDTRPCLSLLHSLDMMEVIFASLNTPANMYFAGPQRHGCLPWAESSKAKDKMSCLFSNDYLRCLLQAEADSYRDWVNRGHVAAAEDLMLTD